MQLLLPVKFGFMSLVLISCAVNASYPHVKKGGAAAEKNP